MMFVLAESWQQSLGAILAATIILIGNQWLANRKQANEIKEHGDKGRGEVKKISEAAIESSNGFNEKIIELSKRIEHIDCQGTAMSIAGFKALSTRIEQMDKQQKETLLEIKHILLYPPGSKSAEVSKPEDYKRV